MTRRADSWTRQCEATTRSGERCKRRALRDSEEGLCGWHSLTPEQLREQARKAAAKSAVVRAGKAAAKHEPSTRLGFDPRVTLEDVLAACVPALEATFEHDGSPDWSARLAAAGTLLAAFPRYLRDTPEAVRALLARILPPVVSETGERLRAQSVYTAMRREWDRLPSWHPVRGLYIRPYPSYMVAPWEDADRVQKERPRDVPPDEAPVIRLPDGQVALRREGDLPLLLDVDGGA